MLERHPTLLACRAGGRCSVSAIEFLRVNVEQSDERVASEDVEVNVWQRLKLFLGLRGGDERKEEAQAGDFRGLLHDVHAEEVVRDDLLFDEVED
ncbi:MAG: hypothetical protein NTY01_09995 [Verrucomicrobia bacterium]|nr:hypothetical protein [Verrucomicrobiota bacterium]